MNGIIKKGIFSTRTEPAIIEVTMNKTEKSVR